MQQSSPLLWPRLLLTAALTALFGCAAARVYPDPEGPRYAGGEPAPIASQALKVVSFNVRYAREIDRAILALGNHELRGADVVALQEMDAPSVERIASALGYQYVYYPAAFHPQGGKDFGNAVLSRWPIIEDHKVVLPHKTPLVGMRRAAVAVTIDRDGVATRVYSVHLEAPFGVTPQQRRDQAKAVATDADAFDGPVIIAGDFNNRDLVGELFEDAGYTWVTRGIGSTIAWFAWDHVFTRGLRLANPKSRGVGNDGDASDHRPVWAELVAG